VSLIKVFSNAINSEGGKNGKGKTKTFSPQLMSAQAKYAPSIANAGEEKH